MLGLFNNLGIKNIVASSILPVRWNAKKLANDKKLNNKIKNHNYDNIKILIEELKKEQLLIQRNISDKFIRNFRRLAFHFDNINITSFPFDYDECIHITQNDNITANNTLLYELYSICYNYNFNKKENRL